MMDLASQMLLFMNTSDPVRGGVYHIGEGTCLALRNMAVYYAAEGLFSESSKVLVLARELFPPHSEHSNIWQLADLIIKFEKALFHGKWSKAQQMQKGISIFDVEESRLRKAQLFLNQGNFAEADNTLKKLLEECETSHTVAPHFYVRALLLRAELMCTTPNYIVSLPSLMTCLAKCKAHHLLLLEAITTVQVASVQLELGLPKQALHLLDGIFISLLTHGTCYDKGCCCFLYARCLAYDAIESKDKSPDSSKKDMLAAAVSMSNRALGYFKKIKALQKMKLVLGWQAHIYNYLNMNEERNNAAYRFRNLEDELT
ncbi:Anaphase-promoting complex subunit 5, partial [Stegodyphus mimosarum]